MTLLSRRFLPLPVPRQGWHGIPYFDLFFDPGRGHASCREAIEETKTRQPEYLRPLQNQCFQ